MATPDEATGTGLEAATVTARPAGDELSNPAPAFEEGPHLKGEIRAAKREQLLAAGISHDDDGLTDDMRELLKEKE